jgi:hypothetical protein
MNRHVQQLFEFAAVATVCGLILVFIWLLGNGNFGHVGFYWAFYAVILAGVGCSCSKPINSPTALCAQAQPALLD